MRGGPVHECGALGRGQLAGDGGGDLASDLLLKSEQVRCGPVVGLAPDSEPTRRVDEARDDAHARAGATQTSLNEMTDSHRVPHRDPVVRRGLPKPAYALPACLLDQDATDISEARSDLLCQPVGEIRVRGVGGQVVEVQHRDAVRDRRYGTDRGAARRRRAVGALGGGKTERWNDGKECQNDQERTASRGLFPSFRLSILQSSHRGRDSSISRWNRASERSGSNSGARSPDQNRAPRGCTCSKKASAAARSPSERNAAPGSNPSSAALS